MLWNANGLAQHAAEVRTFLQNQKANIMLISVIHFTMISHVKIPNYTTYDTQHPNGTAHEGTAIILTHYLWAGLLIKYPRFLNAFNIQPHNIFLLTV